MSDFTAAVAVVLSHESGRLIFNDNGRVASKWGVTLQSAREFYPNCTAGDIARMDPQGASEFYRMAFWNRYGIGRIEDQALATRVFDLAVNMGGGTAIKLLQRAVGANDDGIMGPATLALVNGGAAAEILSTVKSEAEQHYRNLALANPALQKDLPGWPNRLNA